MLSIRLLFYYLEVIRWYIDDVLFILLYRKALVLVGKVVLIIQWQLIPCNRVRILCNSSTMLSKRFLFPWTTLSSGLSLVVHPLSNKDFRFHLLVPFLLELLNHGMDCFVLFRLWWRGVRFCFGTKYKGYCDWKSQTRIVNLFFYVWMNLFCNNLII